MASCFAARHKGRAAKTGGKNWGKRSPPNAGRVRIISVSVSFSLQILKSVSINYYKQSGIFAAISNPPNFDGGITYSV